VATGRIGVTPTLRTRWSKQPTAGTTSLSGLDDNSVALVYDVGYEAVYRNGTLLSRGNDYTATNGTTVTLIDATLAGDIIEILANQLVPLADAISKGQFTAKGALLSATAASTPGVLAVGSNGQYLSADSTASTGLAWATPAAGGMTLLSTINLASVTSFTSIPTTYKSLYVVVRGFRPATNARKLQMQLNGDGGTSYIYWASNGTQFNASGFGFDRYQITDNCSSGANSASSIIVIELADTAGTTTWQWIRTQAIYADSTSAIATNASYYGAYNKTAAITQIDLFSTVAITSGTALLYGVS